MKQYNYNLLIGLNDKDTKIQQITVLDAYKIIGNILTSDGINAYSISEQLGFFTHCDGSITTEKSLNVNIILESKKDFTTIIDTIKTVLNQETIGFVQSTVKVDWR